MPGAPLPASPYVPEGGGGGGTNLHTALTAPSRAAANQHPMSAITGLSAAFLNAKKVYEASVGFTPEAVGQEPDFVAGPTFVLNGLNLLETDIAHLHGSNADGLYSVSEADEDGDQTFTFMADQYDGKLAFLIVNYDFGEADADPVIPYGLRVYVSYYDIDLPGWTLYELTNPQVPESGDPNDGSGGVRFHRYETDDSGDPVTWTMGTVTINGKIVPEYNLVELLIHEGKVEFQLPAGPWDGEIAMRMSRDPDADPSIPVDLDVLAPPGGSINHGRDLGDETYDHFGQTCTAKYMSPGGTRVYREGIDYDQHAQIFYPEVVGGEVEIEPWKGEYQIVPLTEDTTVAGVTFNSDPTVRSCRFVTVQDGTGGWALDLDNAVWAGTPPSPPTGPGQIVEYEMRQIGDGSGAYLVVQMLSASGHWADALPVRSVTGATGVLDSDVVIQASGTFSIDLVNLTQSGRSLIVDNTGVGVITLTGTVAGQVNPIVATGDSATVFVGPAGALTFH